MKKIPEGWKEVELGEVLDYEQPGKYIITGEILESTEKNSVPVLTANKSFILGYTNETEGVNNKLPVIIFDDFTTDNKFVDFRFKVKSSAMKLLRPKNNSINLKYVFLLMQTLKINSTTHKRYYLSAYRHIKIPLPPLPIQKKIVEKLEKAEKIKQDREEANKLTQEYLQSVFYEMFGDPRINNKKWPMEKGNDIFEMSYGSGLTEENRDGGKYPVYGSNGKVGSHSEYLVKGPGIVVGRKGSIGELNFVNDNFWPIDTTYYVNLKRKTDMMFLLFLLKCFNLSRLNKSAAIPGLNRNDVYDINFICPPFSLQQKFAKIVEQIEKIKEHQKESREEIDKMFNSLMSRAFKGELII